MKALRNTGILSGGTLILLIVGLYNGYPLVYSDTGTYIYSGFERFIPLDRPIAYGLFIDFSSWRTSLWLVVITQNLIAAFVIYELLKIMNIKRERFVYFYFSVLGFLTFFTGLAWYTNQIMPDFLAPVFLLTIYILLNRKGFAGIRDVVLYMLLVCSILTHFSHLMIATVLMVVVLFARLALPHRFPDLKYKKIILVSTFVMASWFLLPGINFIVEQRFILSKGSHVFLMAHLDDTGILKKFLDENCDKEDYRDCKLCDERGSLPGDAAEFIWGGDILENTGGWEGSREEYRKIIRGTITRSPFVFMNIWKSFSYGIIQLTRNSIGEGLSPYGEGSDPWGQINWRFPDEVNNYLNSRQNKWGGEKLDLKALNIIHTMLLIACVFILIWVFFGPSRGKFSLQGMNFLLFVLVAIILNSLITGGLNVPYDRYQGRVIWMLPFALILLLSESSKNDHCMQIFHSFTNK